MQKGIASYSQAILHATVLEKMPVLRRRLVFKELGQFSHQKDIKKSVHNNSCFLIFDFKITQPTHSPMGRECILSGFVRPDLGPNCLQRLCCKTQLTLCMLGNFA